MKEVVQEWVTVEFGAAGGEYVQPEEEWLDMEEYTSLAGVEQIPHFSTNLTMYLETAKNREGPWEPVEDMDFESWEDTYTAANQYAHHWVSGRGTDVTPGNRIERLVRVRLVATGAASICMRRTLILK
jgi:hypothetical protein